jgi:hypothetical protein
VRKHFPILAIIVVSSILRIWNLGNIPLGLSLQEVGLGIYLPTAVLIRLPFAIMGVFSVYVMYLIVKKIFEDERLALISAFLLGIIPWHVQESRIFSWGMIFLLVGEGLILLIIKFLDKKSIKLPKFNLYLGILLTLVCIIVPSKNLSTRVDDQRLIVVNNSPKIISRIFVNKITENYRLRQQVLFTNLDFGNYFFAGHPRERGGIEESQKLLLFMLPFIVLGLFKIGRDKSKYLATWTIISLFVLTFFNLQESQTLILILPFVVLASLGIVELLRNNNKLLKWLAYILFAFGFFESLYFYNLYFSGYTESQFSPRRPVYIEISNKLKEISKPEDKILVNDRLGNPKEFLNFYLNKNINGYEFKSYDYRDFKERGILFVDAIPVDPSPKEPLYVKDGGWPKDLDVLSEFYDSGKRLRVVIYRIK